MNQLAIFDLDGTLIRQDSLLEYTKSVVGKPRFYLGLLILAFPYLSYKLGLGSADRLKLFFLNHYLRGRLTADLKRLGKAFADHIDLNLFPEARNRLQWHQQKGHHVVILSASAALWLAPWCERHGFKLISTELNLDTHRFCAEYKTPNCKGQEKVRRLRARFSEDQYEYTFGYGNSKDDLPFLALVQQSNYRLFNA